MLTITANQMESIAAPSLERFKALMLVHVHTYWPEECKRFGADGTRENIHDCISAARRYGLSTEYDTGRFVDLAFALEDASFHDKRWATRYLLDPDYPPRIKMNLLWSEVRNQLQSSS